MQILVRLACCAYIIFYVIVPMLKPTADTDAMSPTARVAVAVAFIAAVVLIIAITVREVIKNWKAGLYKADAYKDDPGVWGPAGADEIGESAEESAGYNGGGGEDDEEDDDDEEDGEDDEDDDDDDYDDDEE